MANPNNGTPQTVAIKSAVSARIAAAQLSQPHLDLGLVKDRSTSCPADWSGEVRMPTAPVRNGAPRHACHPRDLFGSQHALINHGFPLRTDRYGDNCEFMS